MSNELKVSRRELLGTVAATMAGLAAGASASAPQAATRPAPPRALPERREFIITKAHVLTMDTKLGELRNADIHVRDGAIVAVGVNLRAPKAEIVRSMLSDHRPVLVEFSVG
jgi:hypothetical protein